MIVPVYDAQECSVTIRDNSRSTTNDEEKTYTHWTHIAERQMKSLLKNNSERKKTKPITLRARRANPVSLTNANGDPQARQAGTLEKPRQRSSITEVVADGHEKVLTKCSSNKESAASSVDVPGAAPSERCAPNRQHLS